MTIETGVDSVIHFVENIMKPEDFKTIPAVEGELYNRYVAMCEREG